MTEPPLEQRDWRREYLKIIAKVWADPEFGERLRANPVEVLKSEGIDVPERTKVVDLSADASQADCYFVLLPKPESLDEGIVNIESARIEGSYLTLPTIGTVKVGQT